MDSEKVAISLPKDLYENLVEDAKRYSFSTVEDYAAYILRIAIGKQETTNNEEMDKVTQRLKALGYL
jgi:hypothetical protein